MKKILLLLLLAFFSINQSWAQLSDEQVVEKVQNLLSQGKDQRAIAMELMRSGVSQTQLLRIRDKYANSKLAQQQSSTKVAEVAEAKNDRKSNGEKIDSTAVFSLEELTEIRIFGHDIFRKSNLSFEPNMNIATPVTYVLGPGDEVIMDISGISQKNQKFKITPEGTIVIDKIGPVAVSGLTIDQAQSRVKARIGKHYAGSSITLSVGQTRTIVVNVLGEVKTPGTYTLSAFASVFNALYLAGGVTEIGTLRNIKVSRNGRIISTIDVYDYIINGKLTGNTMLRDNDVIIVSPYDALVSIYGPVKRPMYYEMKTGESMKSLLTYAGGFGSEAYRKNVRVERKSSEGLTVKTVDEFDFTTFGLEDGDAVTVDTIAKRYTNMVEIAGAVFHPGKYSLSANCNSVRSLITQAGGFTEDVLKSRGVLYRMLNDRTRKAYTLDIASITDGAAPDVILQNEDSVVIASQRRIIYDNKISIYGEVAEPGEFPYAEGITLEDAIVLAGGLTQSASYTNVEVSRQMYNLTEKDSSFVTTAKNYIFTLKNGLVLEGETNFKLMPNDLVSVRTDPTYSEMNYVYISGEVKFPGIYALTGLDRISDLINRAGGLKGSGSLTDAHLSRTMTPSETYRQKQLYEMTRNEKDTIAIEDVKFEQKYRVGIDLERALAQPGSNADIFLRAKDSLYIPRIDNTVRVNGEVLYPNTVAYKKGKSASYYLNQAGGVSKDGRRSQAFIIYANGEVSRTRKGKVLPGCEIVVPKKEKREDSLQKNSLYITAAGTASTIAAVMISALK